MNDEPEINEKHLEFIQGVINRHNSNSFMIKGWAVTIAAAIFALTGTIKEPYLCFIALGPIIVFWILDSIFLANERCFVSLYNCVSKGNTLSIPKKDLRKDIQKQFNESEKEFTVDNFSMNFIKFREIARNNWKSVLASNTILWFYGGLILLTIATFFGLNCFIKTALPLPLKVKATIVNSDSLKISPINVQTTVIGLDTVQFKQIQNVIEKDTTSRKKK